MMNSAETRYSLISICWSVPWAPLVPLHKDLRTGSTYSYCLDRTDLTAGATLPHRDLRELQSCSWPVPVRSSSPTFESLRYYVPSKWSAVAGSPSTKSPCTRAHRTTWWRCGPPTEWCKSSFQWTQIARTTGQCPAPPFARIFAHHPARQTDQSHFQPSNCTETPSHPSWRSWTKPLAWILAACWSCHGIASPSKFSRGCIRCRRRSNTFPTETPWWRDSGARWTFERVAVHGPPSQDAGQ